MGGVPQPFKSIISGTLGTVGPVTIGGSLGAVGPVTVAGIPDTYHINIDKLPKIEIGVDPLRMHVDPLEFNMRITEIPSIRAHLPANFGVGLSILGFELMCVRLCGEAQVITEPYRPNRCERCGTQGLVDRENPNLSSVPTISVTERDG